MWVWALIRRLDERKTSDALTSEYDRFDLKLHELIVAQQYYGLFPA